MKPDFQHIFESAPDHYLVLDPDLRIVAVSNAYLRATMTERGGIVGRLLFDVFPDNPDDPNATGTHNLNLSLQHVLKYKEANTMAVQKYDIQRPDGTFEERSWSPVNTPVLDQDGKVIYIIHRVEDVSEFMRLKQRQSDLASHAEKMEAEIIRRAGEVQKANHRLAEANQILEKASKMKSEFLANMSHELRTPLNAIIGFSEVLKDGLIGAVSAEQKEYLNDIFSSGQHLLSLINDILDLSKVESGKMEFFPEAVDLLNLLQNGLTIVKESAAARGVRLELTYSALPQRILADARKMKQIIYNLLTNAVKFSPAGSKVDLRAAGRKRAEIEQWCSDAPTARLFQLPQDGNADYIEISIADSGRGIAPEDAPKLFQAFSQVDTSLSREVEGTGLGLVLTLNLVILHRGGMAMESTPNQGSKFTFWIPARIPTDQAENKPATIAHRSAVANKPTVLVIEDDDRAAELAKTQLEAEGFSVLVASDATQGFMLLRDHPIALIILDILLPEIDGWEFLRQIKSPTSDYADIPVIVVTILDGANTGITLGAAQVLQKPVGREDFQTVLASLGFKNPAIISRVLIIDDDRQAVNVMRAYLPENAFAVSEAYDGFSGIEKAKTEKPDLIVLDLLMPDITGFGVLEALRRDVTLRNTPVIIVTSKSLSQAERNELKQKAAQIIPKSEINQQALIAEIHRAMRDEKHANT